MTATPFAGWHPGHVRAALRDLTVAAVVAFVVLAVLTAVAAVVAVLAGLVADVAERLAVAGLAAATSVRHHHAPRPASRGPAWATATSSGGVR
jgi:hypothetical protein